MRLVARTEWGAVPPRGVEPLAAAAVRGVAVHYSAMNADEQARHRNCAQRVRAMQRYHMESNGWLDIAYNHVFCRHGFVFEGRGFGVRSAANGTTAANDRYFAVCFLGDDTRRRNDVTREARVMLARLVMEYRRRYPRARQVRPHSAFTPTSCPGDELRGVLRRAQWWALAR